MRGEKGFTPVKEKNGKLRREPTNDYEKHIFNQKISTVELDVNFINIGFSGNGDLWTDDFFFDRDVKREDLIGAEVRGVRIDEKNHTDVAVEFDNGIVLHTTTHSLRADTDDEPSWDD